MSRKKPAGTPVPKLPVFTFVLALVGPTREQAVKVFVTEGEALKWAAANPPVPLNQSAPDTNDLNSAYYNSPDWPDPGEPGEKPFGYRLYKFDDEGDLRFYAEIQPFVEYDLTTGPSAMTIDPEQELDWT